MGLTVPNSRGTEEPSSRAVFNTGLASGDSGAPVESEDRASGVSAKVKPFDRFQADRKCVEASDNVIERDLTTSVDNRK